MECAIIKLIDMTLPQVFNMAIRQRSNKQLSVVNNVNQNMGNTLCHDKKKFGVVQLFQKNPLMANFGKRMSVI